SLAGGTDLVVAAPGLDITFGRTFSPSVVDRYELGPLGYGWSWAEGWQRTLFVEPDGTVLISAANCGCAQPQASGAQRRFEPDRRRAGAYFPQPGNQAALAALPGGAFELREPDGLVTRFRSDGRVDFIEDLNGNRITAAWTGSLLTRLSHSAGQFLQISYNA